MNQDQTTERIHALEVAQATQTATLGGAQATQSAMQAGTMGTVIAGSAGLVVGIFLGLAIAAAGAAGATPAAAAPADMTLVEMIGGQGLTRAADHLSSGEPTGGRRHPTASRH